MYVAKRPSRERLLLKRKSSKDLSRYLWLPNFACTGTETYVARRPLRERLLLKRKSSKDLSRYPWLPNVACIRTEMYEYMYAIIQTMKPASFQMQLIC